MRSIKKIIVLLISFAMVFGVTSNAFAEPNNPQKAENNPNTVAYYPIGLHAIPTDPITYVTGTNIVTMRGNNGQIQAWFTYPDGHGIHSIWNVSKKGDCAQGWVLIQHAFPVWGDYLTPDTDYCAKVNNF